MTSDFRRFITRWGAAVAVSLSEVVIVTRFECVISNGGGDDSWSREFRYFQSIDVFGLSNRCSSRIAKKIVRKNRRH